MKYRSPLLATLAAAALGVLALSTPARAEAPTEPTIVDPAALAALGQMSTYLHTLDTFRVNAITTRDEVLDNGLKAQFETEVEVLAKKPGELYVHVTSDQQDREFFFDGKQFTLWAPRLRYWAAVTAPPTIADLARLLEARYGIEMPLVDLFRWGTSESREAITAATDLGPGTVDDTTCEHYAFRQEGLDWQVWIQKGSFPLPRRLVLTTTTDEARPQFEATYAWDLAPSFNDAAFAFEPPADAHRITIVENPADGGAGN